MKTLWSLIFFASALFLFCCAFVTRKQKTRLAASLRLCLILIATATLANAVTTATTSRHVALLSFTVLSISLLWTMLLFLEFSVLYATGKIHYKILHKITVIVLCLDTISYVANILTHHAFDIIESVSKNGEVFFNRIPHPAGWVHLGLCYLLLLIAWGIVISQMFSTPPMYWARYILTIAFSMIAFVGEVLFLTLHSNINFAPVGFVLAAPLCTYFVAFYRPHLLIDRMLARVVNKSGDIVLFSDMNNRCMYANEKAQAFFGIPQDKLHTAYSVLEPWFTGLDFKLGDEPNTFICTRVWKGQLTHLKINYDKLYEHKKLIGSFFHIHDITGDVNRYEVQEYRATHDELTGLYTREYLFQRIHRELLIHIEKEYYLLVSDIKDFKLINDIFGRQAGDDLLINSARMIKEYFRSNAIYGRIGYDRYAMLVEQSLFNEAFTQSYISDLNKLCQIDKDTFYPVRIHLGVYPVSKRGVPVSVMIDHASIALDSIKDSHETFFAFYTKEMREQRLWEQQIISEMDGALKARQFEIYLQPQADKTGQGKGAEVLIRWNHPEKGLLSPGDFVPVFEKNGQIIRMDMFVWEEACRLLQKWKQNGHKDFYLSVNISPKDFYYVDVHQHFCDLVKKYDINPAKLKLEITETVMITDLEQKIQLIDKLHDSGFAVEMDDFGSGYSSLNMLKSIPVDVLKIDMAFLYHAKDVKRSQIIIQQVVVLSKELGIPVITEGVETEEQVVFLREIGCDMFQGYYFARPLPVADFEKQYFIAQEGAKC